VSDLDLNTLPAVLLRATFLVLGRCLVMLRIGLLVLGAAIVAHRCVLSRLVLVTLRRMFLLVGTEFVPDGAIVVLGYDHLGHAGRGRQECRGGEGRENPH
jgi:hypothetical protein